MKAGAFRRSELVALDVADLVETEDGYRVTIRHSKRPRKGRAKPLGLAVAIEHVPTETDVNAHLAPDTRRQDHPSRIVQFI